LDSLEVPILDGSSIEFVEMIEEAGIAQQTAARTYLRVLEKVEVRDGNRWIWIEPASEKDEFSISSTIEFSHPFIGRQHCEYRAGLVDYASQIAAARTFGFERETETLRSAGLIRGGSLDNAIVLSETGMLNSEPLRCPDEFGRHKVLDIM